MSQPTTNAGEHRTTTRGRRRQLLFTGGIVAVFLLVGIGIGTAGRLSLDYIIGLFDAGENPTANQYVGIVFLNSIFVFLMAGALMSGIAGLIAGLSIRGRLTAVTIGGGGTFLGFFLMVFSALFILVSILGGGGGDGPGLPTTAVLQTGIASGVIGATTALVGSIISNQ